MIITDSFKATCINDPVPSALISNILLSTLMIITTIINMCLSSGKFPSDLKSAIVLPLLKKSTLDPEVMKNFRPVSNLTFLSKIIEKIIASRLLAHMSFNGLLDKFQLVYKRFHSTETALLRVQNDLLMAVDKGKRVFLVLLDLSAAFDTVDHVTLLSFLREIVGLSGPAMDILKSYLEGRTQRVSIKNILSNLSELIFSVPQGSVLGPLIFCMYTLHLYVQSYFITIFNIPYKLMTPNCTVFLMLTVLQSLRCYYEMLV